MPHCQVHRPCPRSLCSCQWPPAAGTPPPRSLDTGIPWSPCTHWSPPGTDRKAMILSRAFLETLPLASDQKASSCTRCWWWSRRCTSSWSSGCCIVFPLAAPAGRYSSWVVEDQVRVKDITNFIVREKSIVRLQALPQIYIFHIYTRPKFTKPTFTQNPDLHKLKFTQLRFTHTQIYTAQYWHTQIYTTQIYTKLNPNLHNPNLQNPNLHKTRIYRFINPWLGKG